MQIHNPIQIFGGREMAGAIDSESSMFIITEEVFESMGIIEPSLLPNDEKPIDLALCDESIFALSSSG